MEHKLKGVLLVLKLSRTIIPLMLILSIFAGIIPYPTESITITPGITWTVDNETYGVSVPLDFDNITLGTHWMIFNGLGFNLTSPTPIYINFSYFMSHPKSSAIGDMITEFTRTTTALPLTVYYNISGLKNNHQYKYNINLGAWLYVNANATGTISFSTGLPGSLLVKIYDYGYSSPTVQTDPATWAEETNATLHGTLLDDGGSAPITTYSSTTIRPNGVGTYTQLTNPHAPAANYLEVNEVVPEYVNYLYTTNLAYKTDTYLMENPVVTGDIHNVTLVHYHVQLYNPGAKLKSTIRTHGAYYNGTEHTTVMDEHIYNDTWLVNPFTGVAWTWAEINDLEAGMSLKKVAPCVPVFHCMYLSINYSLTVGATSFFQYGLTTAYGTNTPLQYKAMGETFSENILGLTQGTLYHFRAASTNLNGTGYGIDRTFLTKPEAPTALTITNTGINNVQSLNWLHGVGYNTTVMRARVDGPYPITPQADTSIYNNTGASTTVNNTFLLPGRLYYYRAWEYTPWGTLHQFSDLNTTTIGLTKPYAPTNVSINRTSFTKANITWTKGDGANKTIIRYKSTGFPTSPTDGSPIYNGTGTYYVATLSNLTIYYFTTFSYTEWGSYRAVSDNRTDVTNVSGGTFGGFIISSYDEGTGLPLTFNVLISNHDGSQTYQNNGCTTPFPINASLCPNGPTISVFVSSAGYRTRVYTFSIYVGIVYSLTAYLPANTTTGGGGGPGCSPQAFMDSISLNATIRNYVIPLTYRLHTMIQVEVYNTSLGYWVIVPTNRWVNNSNQTVTLLSTYITATSHFSMLRVTYYYLLCAGEQASYLYTFQVIVDDPQGLTIRDASIEIRRYINTTGDFALISNMYTDSNGMFSVYLIPNAIYKIICNKIGYDEEIVTNSYDTTIFNRLIKMTPSAIIPPAESMYGEHIVFNGYINRITHVLYVNYTDDLSNTINCSIYIYEFNSTTNITILFASNITSGDSDIHPSYPGTNNRNTYTVILRHNTTAWDYQTQPFIIGPWVIRLTNPGYTNRLFNANYGYNPLGWTNCIMLGIVVMFLFWGNRDDLPLIYIALGVIFVFANLVIGLFTWSVHAGDFIPIMLVIAGILTAWQRYR